MKTQVRYGSGHHNTSGQYRGVSRAIAATPKYLGGGGGRLPSGLGRAIANTPKHLGGGKSPLDGLKPGPKGRKYPAPKGMARFPIPSGPKYRVSPKVLRHILRSGNPLGLYGNLLGDMLGMLKAWGGPRGEGSYGLVGVPDGYIQSCYSYEAKVPTFECGGDGMWFQPRTAAANTCHLYHQNAQATITGMAGQPVDFKAVRGFMISIGPLRGGVFNCERMDLEHTWQYLYTKTGSGYRPSGRISARRKSRPLPDGRLYPDPAFDPAIKSQGSNRGDRRDRDPVKYERREKPLKPYESAAVSARPGSGSDKFRPGPPHVEEKPGPNANEKKRKFPSELIDKYYGPLTEAKDMLGVIEDSMGDNRCKAPGRTIQERVSCVLRNWRHVDPYSLAANYAKEQAQDYMIGKIGNAHKKAFQHAAEKGYWRSLRGGSVSRWSGRY